MRNENIKNKFQSIFRYLQYMLTNTATVCVLPKPLTTKMHGVSSLYKRLGVSCARSFIYTQPNIVWRGYI